MINSCYPEFFNSTELTVIHSMTHNDYMINSDHIYVNSTFNAAVASHNFPVFRLSHESHDLHVSYILVPLSMILPAVYAAVMFRNKFTTLNFS